jgi:hypothetical protein
MLLANRSNSPIVVMVGVLGLGFWTSPAAGQLAPWQRPPGSSSNLAGPAEDAAHVASPDPTIKGGSLASPEALRHDSTDISSAPWSGENYEEDGGPLGFGRGFLPKLAYATVHDRVWVRTEFLSWWTRGFAVPPLLTTSSNMNDSAQAGVLGNSDTSILLGGENLSGGFLPGERFTLGTWMSDQQTLGVEASYLQLSRQTKFFNTNGTSQPVLARPFFNSETGQPDSQIVSFPGLHSGSLTSATASELQVAEVLIRKSLRHEADLGVDLLAGYRYQQLQDHLAIDDVLTFSGSQSAFPAGSVVQQSDRFDTRNVFQGGEVGVSTTLRRQSWTFETLLKIAVGQTHSRVAIEGATATTIPGQAVTLLPGGLLALPSNIGVYDSNQFSVVPELGLTVGLDISPQLRALVGYNFIYWNNVARPGDQIDLNLDPRQFPPAASTSAVRPEFHLHTSDYWAQGLNLGLDLRF